MSNTSTVSSQNSEGSDEVWKQIRDSELGRPFMLDDLDFSLMTLGEWKLTGQLDRSIKIDY